MTTSERCRLYLEDPEAHAAHLQECAECRALFEEMSERVGHRPVTVDALPLAPWEGASHRSWPLVVGGALTVFAITGALFAAAGPSAIQAVRSSLPSLDIVMSIFRLAGGAVQNAPTTWQIGIAISFVIVNAIFLALLRRAPKGIDV
jgi:hypothetical protein